MLFPECGDGRIDRPGIFVEYPTGIAVGARRRENGLPDIELIAAAASGTQGQLPLVHFLYHGADMSQVVAISRPGRLLKSALHKVSILIVIKVDRRVVAEVYRIGTGGITAIVLIRIENLHSQGLPAAGGAAIGESRPTLSDAAEPTFDFGNQFIGDGIAIGSQVFRVDRIGIIIVRVRMFDLYGKDPGKARSRPLLIEVIGFPLFDLLIICDAESGARIVRQVLLRGRRPEAAGNRMGNAA